MVQINNRCCGCGQCMRSCPLGAISLQDRRAVIDEKCVSCGVCARVCKLGAVELTTTDETAGTVVCSHCPVQCHIPANGFGACKRYHNESGALVRVRKLVTVNTKAVYPDSRLTRPLITGVGAGTNYPCCRPAPVIAQAARDGVDVITVVTEAPLSYSGVTVKLDTNTHIGEEGETVFRNGRPVGMVCTEEYGAKMLQIGGASRLTGANGFLVAQTIVDLANGQAVDLMVEHHTRLTVQHGKPPVINGKSEEKMRVGCGSATIGMFARQMKAVADDVIVIDHHIIGLLSEHLAGAEVGLQWSGVLVNARKSSRGRYFGQPGNGIGGTDIEQARQVIRGADMQVARPGMTVFVTDTTGGTRALFRLNADGTFEEIALTPAVTDLADLIRSSCETARCSVIYTGGAGGSARAGVCARPLKLTEAVHEGKAVLTIGGAPAFVLPGGGINFMVDVGQVVDHAFTWVPTPATVAPVEYTLTRETYEAIGGHIDQIVHKEQIPPNDM